MEKFLSGTWGFGGLVACSQLSKVNGAPLITSFFQAIPS
jgi:hypothetical protein